MEKSKDKYIDENGYERGYINHSDLIHRQIAYKEIYLKNREKYPLPFSSYVVHHKDEDKRNNLPSNLQLVTKEQHNKIHGIKNYPKNNFFLNFFIFHMLCYVVILFIFTILFPRLKNGTTFFISLLLYLFMFSWWTEIIRENLKE